MGTPIRSEKITYGRNYDKGVYPEDWVRCSRCGHPCNLHRDQREPDGSRAGWGMKYETIGGWGQGGWGSSGWGGVENVKDPIVTSGCPQCGTYRYDK